MGDIDQWKNDDGPAKVKGFSGEQQDHAGRSSPHLDRTSLTGSRTCLSTKVSNGAGCPVDVGEVVIPIDCDESKPCRASVRENDGKTNGPFVYGLNSVAGSTISFRDVSYQIETRVRTAGCSCKNESQYILKNVSGIFRPGLNVILGPTGSGKTTLLDILAGRKDSRGCSGDVLVDGKSQPHNFKCMSGYVIQDDIIMGMLTVRENIEFSAALRLPSQTTSSQRRERVDEIINDLGLSKCASSRVGTEFIRGISGGERKRTNIAMELITLPRVLFLDEPTSGLDANTAYSVMHLLKSLSHRGMTIIMSIHQPRYSIFKLFDTITLLSRGSAVFHGPADQAIDFFTANNYICEEHNNPPDFFLDILSGTVQCKAITVDVPSKKDDEDLKENLTTGLIQDSEEVETTEERLNNLVNSYQKSKWRTQLDTDLQAFTNATSQTGEKLAGRKQKTQPITYPTSFFSQLRFVSCRTWRNMVRNRHALMTQICSAVILGLIVGTIYYQVGDSYSSGIQNRVGAFFFIVMNYVFGNMSAVDIFIKERAVFIHETVSGYYRVSTYFIAKLLCDVGPQRIFPILVFASISYFMIGFHLEVDHFLFYVLNTILTSLAGTSVALLFSATTRQHSIGTVLTALVWVCMMVFSGILVNVSTVPSFLRWLKWFSIFQYSMNAFQVNELKGLVFTDELVNATELSFHRDTGDEYLSRQGIPHEYSWDLWSNELALSLIGLGFLALTYIQLRRTKTVK